MKKKQSYTIRIMIRLCLLIILFMQSTPLISHGVNQASAQPTTWEDRLYLYQQISQVFQLPWSYLAAIDQFERTMRKPDELQKSAGFVAIQFPAHLWSGILNPNPNDTNPGTIGFYTGIGRDGSGDEIADPNDDVDLLYTMASYLSQYGWMKDDFRLALWRYYQNEKIVEIITEFAVIYDKYQRLDLFDNQFPIPAHFNYSYKNTWGAPRGWGGRRIHEGTDIFAGYGTPIRSTCYGYVESMGWNRFGGWRIGVRDLNNHYHYFAHLSGFNKEIKEGQIVEPGEILGYVGSSGYGKPGTQGKFPPHLHYGIYKYTMKGEWSFDPYPHLRKWERQMFQKKKR
ncbi:M23 family metallopeptidase [Rubeoparvulum massiliense]|uniref:M23 family metallopeptidase n=1 Tax=Rubeoparvulum massiliense TaxID=1631346 RepID=UPI00065DE6E0|nr:M23 family metallopeptidase [Rubeoparvulum massiliense]